MRCHTAPAAVRPREHGVCTPPKALALEITQGPGAQVYHQLAEGQGIVLHGPSPHAVKDFSLAHLPGAYRRLVTRPGCPSFQLLRYWDPSTDLARTDLAALEGRGAQPLQCQRLDMQGARRAAWRHDAWAFRGFRGLGFTPKP